MSYVIRDTPHDKQAYVEQRNLPLNIAHTFVINTYDSLANSLLPATYHQNLNGFTINALTGELTYTEVNTEFFEIDVVIQGLAHDIAGATVIEGATFVNGVIDTDSQTYYNISSTALDSIIYHYKQAVQLAQNDVVEFRLRNISRTETGSFYHYHIIVKTILNLI